MLGLPQLGESVTFRIAEGRRVPMVGRPGAYYALEKEYIEAWSDLHLSRLREGAIQLIKWSFDPKGLTAEQVVADEKAEAAAEAKKAVTRAD